MSDQATTKPVNHVRRDGKTVELPVLRARWART